MAERRTGTIKPPETEIVEWYGRLEDAPLFPDLEYWQSQPDTSKFQAVHEMIIEAHLGKTYVERDFKELLSILNEDGVEYLIVGGYAVIKHTEPRYTTLR